MSPTRAFKFDKNPLRALEDYQGIHPWWEGKDDALLFGKIVHNLAEGREMLRDFTDEEKNKLLTKKGTLYANYQDAELVGKALHDYVVKISGDETPLFETELRVPDSVVVADSSIDYDLTGRADMLTDKAVFDFKTVGANDFDGFLKYGSFRDGREEEYKMQVALYAAVFEKSEAHIIYIKKDRKTPFIYDYQLSEQDLYDATEKINELITKAVKIVAGYEEATAINDSSEWAFEKFGGVINDSQAITL